ncbi:MAG: hypothetical protein HZA07_07445 [Nitrospirae bacterium]|nr:hypothetical protein [Nitrospirota bacterium]
MDDRRKFKRYIVAGAIFGGVISLTISILMDTIYGDSLQGTWRDAIAKDLNRLFSLSVTSDSLSVIIVFIFILAILSLFGSFMGVLFILIIYKFFNLLHEK